MLGSGAQAIFNIWLDAPVGPEKNPFIQPLRSRKIVLEFLILPGVIPYLRLPMDPVTSQINGATDIMFVSSLKIATSKLYTVPSSERVSHGSLQRPRHSNYIRHGQPCL